METAVEAPKYTNTEEIRLALGLDPWNTKALDGVQEVLNMRRELGDAKCWQGIQEGWRTGRSTRIICEALVNVASGRLVLLDSPRGSSSAYFLVGRARDCAQQLDLAPGLIHAAEVRHRTNEASRNGAAYFMDA